jgi:hypothetical protein
MINELSIGATLLYKLDNIEAGDRVPAGSRIFYSILFSTCVYPQKMALTSPTSGGRLVGVVCSRTQAAEFSLMLRFGAVFPYPACIHDTLLQNIFQVIEKKNYTPLLCIVMSFRETRVAEVKE